MRSWHWAALAGIAFVLGTGLGYVIASQGEQRPTIRQVTEHETARQDPGREESLDDSGIDERPTTDEDRESSALDREGTTPADRAEAPPTGLVQALKALPKPADIHGTGRITGELHDAHGNPVADVTIELAPLAKEGTSWPRLYDSDDRELYQGLSEDIRRIAEYRALRAFGRREVVTDAQGQWAADGLGERRYRVSVKGARLEVLRDMRHKIANPGEHVKLSVHRLFELAVRILTPDGEATSELRPEIVSATDRTRVRSHWAGASNPMTDEQEWESAEPDVHRTLLPPGAYVLSVRSNDYSAPQTHLVEIVDRDHDTVEIRVAQKPGIKGSVTVRGGDIQDSLQISYRKLEADESIDDAAAELASSGRIWVREEGYRISVSEPGRYLLGIVSKGVTLHWEVLDYSGGVLEHDLTVDAPAAAETIVCRVSGDLSLLGREPRFGMGFDGASREVWLANWKISENEYRIIPPSESQLQGRDPAYIRLRTSSSGIIIMPVQHAGPQVISAEIKAAGSLVIHDEGWKRPEQRNTRITIALKSGDGHVVARQPITDYGRLPVILSPVQLGDYRLCVEWDDITLLDEPVTIGSTALVKDVSLPEFHTLTLTRDGEYRHVNVTSDFRPGRYEQRVTVGRQRSSGSIEVPAGVYTLTWQTDRRGGEATRTVHVSSDTTVVIDR